MRVLAVLVAATLAGYAAGAELACSAVTAPACATARPPLRTRSGDATDVAQRIHQLVLSEPMGRLAREERAGGGVVYRQYALTPPPRHRPLTLMTFLIHQNATVEARCETVAPPRGFDCGACQRRLDRLRLLLLA